MTVVTSAAENTNITSVTSPESYIGTSAFQNTNQLSGRVSSAPVTEIHTKKESINTAGNTEAQKLSEITSKEKVSQTSKSVTYTTTGKTSTETEYTGTRPVTTISEKPQTSATVPDTTVIVKPSETRKITLDDIIRLSHKGTELDWSDFNEYEYTDVGSGLFIFEYRLEDNMYKVWDYLSELKLKADFQENPDEYDGMTWVITLTCAAGHTETIYHFGNMFIRDENGSWYKMDYDQASGFHALLEE